MRWTIFKTRFARYKKVQIVKCPISRHILATKRKIPLKNNFSQFCITYHWTCYFVPSLATLLNRFRVYLSLETAFKAFKNWYFDQNLGVGHEARFASFCFTLWWKIRILRILFHTMMKNTHFAYFVSHHDEKWHLFNGKWCKTM